MSEDWTRVSGMRATYRGREYDVVAYSETHVDLAGGDLDSGEFPEEFRRGQKGARPWVEVPLAAVERLVSVRVRASWRGQEIQVLSVARDKVAFSFVGPPDFARENGLQGSQYEGWGGSAPRHEVGDLHEEVRELRR